MYANFACVVSLYMWPVKPCKDMPTVPRVSTLVPFIISMTRRTDLCVVVKLWPCTVRTCKSVPSIIHMYTYAHVLEANNKKRVGLHVYET